MKRTISLMIIVAMLAMTACGSEKAEMTADDTEILNEIQEDLTKEDKEIIDEIKEELQEEVSSEEASSEETVYTLDFEPTDEILNAQYEEGKVQVGKDMVFQLVTMTFADVDKIIKESEEAERYRWGDYNQYIPDNVRVVLYIDDKAYCTFTFLNAIDNCNNRIKIDDCILVGVDRATLKNLPVLFYAGGICSDGRDINLDNAEDLFKNYETASLAGKEYVIQPTCIEPNTWTYPKNTRSDTSQLYYLCLLTKYGTERHPCVIDYSIRVSLKDGNCSEVSMGFYNCIYEYKRYDLQKEDFIMLDALQNDSALQTDSSTTDEHSDSAWGDIEVKEYVDDEYGIHFYLPASAKITVKEPWYNFDIVNRTYYISGDGFNGEEYLCQTQKAPEGMGGDSIEDELFGEIAKKDGYVYSINFLNPDTQYDFELSDAMIKFISDYRQKILDSAWVE